jgi:hypothetical protein
MADGAATVRSRHGTGRAGAAAIMAAKKEAGLTRRKASAGRGDNVRLGRKVEKAGHDVAVAGADPWGSFFENFWGPAEGEGADPPDGGRQPAKGTRKTGMKPGR